MQVNHHLTAASLAHSLKGQMIAVSTLVSKVVIDRSVDPPLCARFGDEMNPADASRADLKNSSTNNGGISIKVPLPLRVKYKTDQKQPERCTSFEA